MGSFWPGGGYFGLYALPTSGTTATPPAQGGLKRRRRERIDPAAYRHRAALSLAPPSLPGWRWAAVTTPPSSTPSASLQAPTLALADLAPVVRGRRAIRRNKARVSLSLDALPQLRLRAFVQDSEGEQALRILLHAVGWLDG